MSGENAHAGSVAAQLQQAEDDGDLPGQLAERLEAAKNQRSTTSPEKRTRCPDCKGVSIAKRVGRKGGGHNPDGSATENYYCQDCAEPKPYVLEPDDPDYPAVCQKGPVRNGGDA